MNIDFDKLRDYLRDYPEVNFLLNNEEQFPEDLMESMLSFVVSDVKATTPALSNMINKIPMSVMIDGLIARLMNSEAFVQLRNQVQVSDNNISSTSIYGKQGSYLQLAQLYQQKFQQGLSQIAKQNFYNNCWDQDISSNSQEIEFGALFLPPDLI